MPTNTLNINEVFYSIQGESSRAGLPTVFIRTTGCHLRCHYCDTKYAYHSGQLRSIEELLLEVKKYPTQYVCLTGGEPLLQKSIYALMEKLLLAGYDLSVETSGDLSCREVPAKVLKVIDIKTPDSGAAHKIHKDNLNLDDTHVEYKFVITSMADFEWSLQFIDQNQLHQRGKILYSPSFGKIEEKWLAKKILDEIPTARLQLQLHKYIWSPHLTGV